MGPQHFQSRVLLIYQFSFVVGVLSFTLATFCSLSYLDQDTTLTAFAFLIRLAACFSATAELLELVAAPIPMWRTRLCLLGLIGQALYLWSADASKQFNSGEGYVMATLCTSIAAELKILALIMEKRSFEQIMLKEKHRFFQFGCLAVGSVLFLVGTLLFSLSDDKQWAGQRAGWINCLGGVVYAAAIVMMCRKEKYQGYKKFRQAMEIPSVIAQ